jgi:cytochrome c biogenesis protein CcmG/thiol:disulfide interchange protein DsbE
VAIDWGVYGAPETFLIDKQGVIRFKHVGPLTRELLQTKLLPLVRQLQGA